MRLLIDTHIFLWWINDDRRSLSRKAISLITEADEVYVSSASIWEAIIKIKLKKLQVEIDDLLTSLHVGDFLELPITAVHAAAVYQLPDFHRDPFDRILMAQAVSEPLKFLTSG